METIAHKSIHKDTHDHDQTHKNSVLYSAHIYNNKDTIHMKQNRVFSFYIARKPMHKDTIISKNTKRVFVYSAQIYTQILTIQMKKCFYIARISNRQMQLTMLVGLVSLSVTNDTHALASSDVKL
jgi:hypothetical protein